MVEKGHLSPEAMDRILSKKQQPTNDTRKNVVTLRITDEINQTLDDLVSLSIAQSRSEAAYMLIVEGINARADLFEQIRKHSEEIEKIKKGLQQTTFDFGQLK